jgi:RHS repeat-associated protein
VCPAEIRDWRISEEWPDGAKPVTRTIEYDDLYRVSRLDYAYAGGDDDWVSPFDTELNEPAPTDPRRATPSPHVSFEKRTLWQSYQYDWLGNTSSTRDDANGFYDRSLGAITNGGAAGKPYQLHQAHGATGTRSGNLDTVYDAAGNLTRLNVVRNGPCLGGQCSQRFAYYWDEVGRLVRAKRWDLPANDVGAASAELPTSAAAADLSYAYDAGDQRVLKTARDGSAESHTLYVFETLELRRAPFIQAGENSDYELTHWTEIPYLFANGVRLARVVWHDAPGDEEMPVPNAAPVTGQHVLFELGDHLGSTSVVLDMATSELVERSSFYAYGSTESDYRPDRWKGFRSDYRFTGKEEDVEVGLTYFGKRYLNPLLGRWVSPDPLAVHAPGEADWNLYAYVSGEALKNVDPLGLDYEEPVNSSPATVKEGPAGAGGDAHATFSREFATKDAPVTYEQGDDGNNWYANVEVRYKFDRGIGYVREPDLKDPADNMRPVREHEFAHHAVSHDAMSKEAVEMLMGNVGATLRFRVPGRNRDYRQLSVQRFRSGRIGIAMPTTRRWRPTMTGFRRGSCTTRNARKVRTACP